MKTMRANSESGFTHLVGIGGIGAGIVFVLEGDQTLGRNESRLGRLLDARDYCKLHIVEHYVATIMGCAATPARFSVSAVGVVGDDDIGRQLVREMENVGIAVDLVRRDARLRTLFSVCFGYPDGTGGNITTSNSAAASINGSDVERATKLLRSAGKCGIATCLPEVPIEVQREFLLAATRCGSFRAASFASAEVVVARDTGLLSMVDLLALNKEEASALVGYSYEGATHMKFLQDFSAVVAQLQPEMRILLSVGAEGAYACEAGTWGFCPAPRVQVQSTAGAGDALLAGTLCGISAGIPLLPSAGAAQQFHHRSLNSSLEFGVLLASYTVQSPHTIHPDASLDSLLEFAKTQEVTFARNVENAFFPSGETVAAG